MRQTQFRLTDRQLQAHAADFLQSRLRFVTYGLLCTPAVLLGLLLYAAAWRTSLSHACGMLRNAPSDETARQALLANLPDEDELKRRLNRLLADARFARRWRRRRRGLPVAVDITQIPYYGADDTAQVYRSKSRQGTRRFFAYATAYLMVQGQRFTLAVDTIAHGEAIEDVLKRLLRRVARLGVRIRYLLLDRGFYKVAVIRYLQAARYPFLMPVIARGRKATADRPAGGTRGFAQRKRSGWSRYTLQDRKKQRATVSICVHCHNHRGKKGRHGRYAWVYAYWGLQPSSYTWVSQTYRQRFGIESSYRQMNQARARTSSRNPVLRLLYVGVALVLRNLWVWWHHAVLAQRRRGGRQLRLQRLRLLALLQRIAQVCAQLLGGLKEVLTDQPVPS